MDLSTYICDSSRRTALARACATSPDYLYQIATGRRRASPRLAEKIEENTAKLGPFVVTKESVVFGPPPEPAEPTEQPAQAESGQTEEVGDAA